MIQTTQRVVALACALFFAAGAWAARPLVIAHRGDSAHAPENTLASFEAAVVAGADWVELDVHLSRDGELMVCHDETVDRTTNGHGKIADLTRAQIQELDAGGRFGAAFRGERVPTLGQVLARMKGRAGVLIELKNVHGKSEELVKRCMAAVNAAGVVPRVRFHTFFPDNLRALYHQKVPVPYAFLYDWARSGYISVSFAHSYAAHGYNPRLIHTTRAAVDQAHRFGMDVWPYVADTPDEFRKAIALGADGIITDRPGDLKAFLAPL